MTEKELQSFEETRDIEAEILQGIDDMLANNAAKRTVINLSFFSLAYQYPTSRNYPQFLRTTLGIKNNQFCTLWLTPIPALCAYTIWLQFPMMDSSGTGSSTQ